MNTKIILGITIIVLVSGCIDGNNVEENPEETLEDFLEEQYSENPDYELMYEHYSENVQENHPYEEWIEEMREPLDELYEAGGSLELLSIETLEIENEEAELEFRYRVYNVVSASESGTTNVAMVKENDEWKIDQPNFIEIDILEE